MEGEGNDSGGIQEITGSGFWGCGVRQPCRYIQNQDRQRATAGKAQAAVSGKGGESLSDPGGKYEGKGKVCG